MKVTVLYDNVMHREDIAVDWGFACAIETGEQHILFDTGAHGDMLLSNMHQLGFSPASFDTMVISHDHWDHNGGIESVLAENAGMNVMLHTGFSEETKNLVRASGAALHEIARPQQLLSDVWTTGPMGTDIVEQALVLETGAGLVMVTGCAHPGIVKMVELAKDMLGEDIVWVMGGLHLKNTPAEEVLDVIGNLQELGVLNAASSHCTGHAAMERFANAFGDGYVASGAGWTRTF